MNVTQFLWYLLVMAGTTYLVRLLPMVLVKKKITNTFLLSFLYYIPYAVLSVMTVPAVFSATGHFSSALVGVAAALLLAYFEKGLLIVAAGASLGALLMELLLLL